MEAIEVLIVDDTRLVSEGINALLSREPSIKVVGTVFSGAECLRFLDRHSVDVLLLDHEMPGLNGLETLTQLRQRPQHPRVILLTLHEDATLVRTYSEAGAAGCILKNDSVDEFVFGIQQVAAGKTYHSAAVERLMQNAQAAAQAAPLPVDNPVANLTKAEQEVLALIGQGLTVTEISELRHTSAKTVSRQKQNIMDKLDIHKETKLMRYAIVHGIE